MLGLRPTHLQSNPMFSTICLLFLAGFLFWMNTSARISWPDKNRVMAYMASYPLYSRFAAGALFLLATGLCVGLLGVGSGLFAAVVILMTTGSVSVLFFLSAISAQSQLPHFTCAR